MNYGNTINNSYYTTQDRPSVKGPASHGPYSGDHNKRSKLTSSPAVISSSSSRASHQNHTYNNFPQQISHNKMKEFCSRISSNQAVHRPADLIDEAKTYHDAFDARGFATVLHKVAKNLTRGDRIDQTSLDALLNKAWYKLNEFNPQGLANSLWALAKLAENSYYQVDHSLVNQLEYAAKGKLSQFNPQGLANSLWALAKLAENSDYQVDHSLVNDLIDKAWYKLNEFNPQDLANSLWALAKLSKSNFISIDNKLLDALLHQLSNALSLNKGQAIDYSTSIYSLSVLDDTIGYKNNGFIQNWLESINKVTNVTERSPENDLSLKIAITYVANFANTPLELECKVNNRTLLSIDDKKRISTISLTNLPIDMHNISQINRIQGCYIPYMSPMSVKFTQDNISASFRCDFNGGPDLLDILEGKAKSANWRNNLTPIRVVRIQKTAHARPDGISDGIYSLDNRRLYIYKELYMCKLIDTVPVILVDINKDKITREFISKLRTKTQGENIHITGGGYKTYRIDDLDRKRRVNDEMVLDEIVSNLNYA